jgi:hypothetical protein
MTLSETNLRERTVPPQRWHMQDTCFYHPARQMQDTCLYPPARHMQASWIEIPVPGSQSPHPAAFGIELLTLSSSEIFPIAAQRVRRP